MRQTIMLVVAMSAALAAAGGAEARTIANWPCKTPYAEHIAAASVWRAPPPLRLDPAWRHDAAARRVVFFAANPENNPERGKAAIAAFARAAGAERERALVRVFTGLLDESDSLHAIIIAGIRTFVLRAKILAAAVDENDDALKALSRADDEGRRGELRQARFWNFRNMDDAEEEAVFQCRRLSYLHKKLRILSDEVRRQMTAP